MTDIPETWQECKAQLAALIAESLPNNAAAWSIEGRKPTQAELKDWPHCGRAYDVRIQHPRLREPFLTTYKVGTGHAIKKSFPTRYLTPESVDVFSSLLMDAYGAAESFDSWAAEYGYDSDSRKAHAIYLECQRTRDAMMRIFGASFDRACQLACGM